MLSPVLIKSFSLTLLAEWGDRSQIATTTLTASRDLYGVIAGGILGHGLCSGVAVVGGRMLDTRISDKAVALIGGTPFVSNFEFLRYARLEHCAFRQLPPTIFLYNLPAFNFD